MTILGCLLIDGSLKIEFFDDITGSEVEIISYNTDEIIVSESILDGSVRVYID